MVIAAAAFVMRRRRRHEVYEGIDHPLGSLEVTLHGDGRFVMTLALWDPVVGAVVGEKSLGGTWRRAGGMLELRSAARHVVYHRSGGMDVEWIWRQSDLPTFADGIALVRRRDRSSVGPPA